MNTPGRGWFALLVLAAAAALRLVDLGRWSLDGDELYSWFDVQTLLAGEPWPFGARSHPLGYFLMAGVTALLGHSEWALRLGPALCSLGAVAALLWMRRDVVPRGTALAAGTLAALSPWLVFHGQNARFYGPLLLFAALATLWALPGPGRRPRASAAAWVASVLCHPTAALLGPALVVPLLRPPVPWRRLAALAGAVVGVLLLVWALDDGALEDVVLRVLEKRDPGRYGAAHLVMGLGYNLGPLVGLLIALGVAPALRAQSGTGPLLLAAATLAPLVLLAVASFGLSMHQRYAMCAVPAALLLAGEGWRAATERTRAGGAALAVLALAAFTPGLVAYRQDGNRHDFRALAAFLHERVGPGDILVADEHSTVELYIRKVSGFADVKVFEEDLVDDKKRTDFLGNKREVWVAVKTSRLQSGAYGADFTRWLDDFFTPIGTVGVPPPPLVRHDNRYRVFRRTERILSRRTSGSPPEDPTGSPTDRGATTPGTPTKEPRDR